MLLIAPRITESLLGEMLRAVPDSLLLGSTGGPEFATSVEARERYGAFLMERLRAPRSFLA